MIRELLQRFWKDPVWSKVISVGVVAVITLNYKLVLAISANTSFSTALKSLWTYKIDLWVIVLFGLVIALLLVAKANYFKYNNDTLNLDRKLFNMIRTENNMEDFVQEVKFHGFSGGPVRLSRIDTLSDFLSASEKSDFHFFNSTLERLKTKVVEDIKALDESLDTYYFGTDNKGWISIPSEWEYTQPERMKEAKEVITQREDKFSSTYHFFIVEGRKILKV